MSDRRPWQDKCLDEFTPEDEAEYAAFKQGERDQKVRKVEQAAEEKWARKAEGVLRWRRGHRDAEIERARLWRLGHKEQTKAYDRKRYAENGEAIRQKRRDRYAARKAASKGRCCEGRMQSGSKKV